MSTQRKMRADKRAENQDPINFTCGVCMQVHEFISGKPYECTNKIVVEKVSEEMS